MADTCCMFSPYCIMEMFVWRCNTVFQLNAWLLLTLLFEDNNGEQRASKCFNCATSGQDIVNNFISLDTLIQGHTVDTWGVISRDTKAFFLSVMHSLLLCWHSGLRQYLVIPLKRNTNGWLCSFCIIRPKLPPSSCCVLKMQISFKKINFSVWDYACSKYMNKRCQNITEGD